VGTVRTDIDLVALSECSSHAAGEAIEIVSVEDVESGANKSTHLKLFEKSGRIFGLKRSTRFGQRGQNGTRQEFLAWHVARLLGLSGTGTVALIPTAPPGTGSLSGTETVLVEWMPDAKTIGELIPPASALRSSEPTAVQIGGWVWLALRLGISDRHPGNWVWSESRGSMAMIDLEEWSYGSHTASEFVGIAAPVLGLTAQDKPLLKFGRQCFIGAKRARDEFDVHQSQIDAEFARLGIQDPSAGKGPCRRR
jgi:hypothetical protein